MADELTTRLRAALDAEEARAQANGGYDPDDVLRVIEAHREIVAEHEAAEPDYQTQPWTICATCIPDREWPCPTLLAVAGVYAINPSEE